MKQIPRVGREKTGRPTMQTKKPNNKNLKTISQGMR